MSVVVEVDRTSKIKAANVRISPRETEIARLIAQGYSNKQIASQLGLSSATVGTYLTRIFHKLSVHTRSEMIAKLISGGYLVLVSF